MSPEQLIFLLFSLHPTNTCYLIVSSPHWKHDLDLQLMWSLVEPLVHFLVIHYSFYLNFKGEQSQILSNNLWIGMIYYFSIWPYIRRSLIWLTDCSVLKQTQPHFYVILVQYLAGGPILISPIHWIKFLFDTHMIECPKDKIIIHRVSGEGYGVPPGLQRAQKSSKITHNLLFFTSFGH